MRDSPCNRISSNRQTVKPSTPTHLELHASVNILRTSPTPTATASSGAEDELDELDVDKGKRWVLLAMICVCHDIAR